MKRFSCQTGDWRYSSKSVLAGTRRETAGGEQMIFGESPIVAAQREHGNCGVPSKACNRYDGRMNSFRLCGSGPDDFSPSRKRTRLGRLSND
jgi:hypothetical protein